MSAVEKRRERKTQQPDEATKKGEGGGGRYVMKVLSSAKCYSFEIFLDVRTCLEFSSLWYLKVWFFSHWHEAESRINQTVVHIEHACLVRSSLNAWHCSCVPVSALNLFFP